MIRTLAILLFIAPAYAGTCEVVFTPTPDLRMCIATNEGLKELREQDRENDRLKDQLIATLKAKIALLEKQAVKPKRKKRRK